MSGEGVLPCWRSMRRAKISPAPSSGDFIVDGPEPERSRVAEALARMPDLGAKIAAAQYRALCGLPAERCTVAIVAPVSSAMGKAPIARALALSGYRGDGFTIDDPLAIVADLADRFRLIEPPELIAKPTAEPEAQINNRQARRRAAAQRRKGR